MKNDNYYVIWGKMINELGLSGNELLVYAVIHGFSQTENQWFTGSLKYIAEATCASKSTVIRSLNSLLDKGFIEKGETYCNDVKMCRYRVVKMEQVVSKWNGYCQNDTGGGVKMTPGWCQNDTGGGVKMTPNNNIYNTNDKIEDKIVTFDSDKPKKSKPKSKVDFIPDWFEEVWKMYPRKEGKNAIGKEAFKALSEAGKETIISAIDNYKRNLLENRTDKKYILMGSTFFNGRWEDYVNREGETNGTSYASNPGFI